MKFKVSRADTRSYYLNRETGEMADSWQVPIIRYDARHDWHIYDETIWEPKKGPRPIPGVEDGAIELETLEQLCEFIKTVDEPVIIEEGDVSQWSILIYDAVIEE